MILKLIFCVVGLIVLFILSIKYLIKIKKNDKISLKQKIYLNIITLGYFSIIMHIFEYIFFTLKIQYVFNIAWYVHWITTYLLFLLIFYYFIIYLDLTKSNKLKEVLFGNDIKNIKISYFIFLILLMISLVSYVSPIGINDTFEFVPFKYGIFILGSMGLYGIFLLLIVIKYLKKNKDNKKTKLLNMIITIVLISIGAIFQIILSDMSILSLGIILAICYIYNFIEND